MLAGPAGALVMPAGVVLLVRHGQAMVGTDDYDRLSEVGARQTQLLAEALLRRGVRPTAIIDGGLRRHAQSADLLAGLLSGALTGGGRSTLRCTDPDWSEFDYRGVLTMHRPDFSDRAVMRAYLAGQPDPPTAYAAIFREATARWLSGQADQDYREPYPAFRERVSRALRRAGAGVRDGAVAVVVTSAGPISTVAVQLLDSTTSTWYRVNSVLANTGVSTVENSADGPLLRTLNDCGHLHGGGPELLTYQ